MNSLYVRIDKLHQVSDTETLALGYWIIGRLVNEVTVGQPVLVERYIRNGEKVLGVMNTSIVEEITPWSVPGDDPDNMRCGVDINTKNSIYRIEFLDENEIKDMLLDGAVLAPSEDKLLQN